MIHKEKVSSSASVLSSGTLVNLDMAFLLKISQALLEYNGSHGNWNSTIIRTFSWVVEFQMCFSTILLLTWDLTVTQATGTGYT